MPSNSNPSYIAPRNGSVYRYFRTCYVLEYSADVRSRSATQRPAASAKKADNFEISVFPAFILFEGVTLIRGCPAWFVYTHRRCSTRWSYICNILGTYKVIS